MKQVFLSGTGLVEVLDVPVPKCIPGGILVRNAYSLISSGTEGASVTGKAGLMGLYEKARGSGERVRQVWELSHKIGPRQTMQVVRNKLKDSTMLGYSSAGVVVEANSMPSFPVGCRVACMGTLFANHAEYVTVPRNLAAKVPNGVSFKEAAFAALACIAMQGVRRLGLSSGECVGVIGLGLIGQISVRLLRAMGYESIGIDLSSERVDLAKQVDGLQAWTSSEGIDSIQHAHDLTSGHGLDGVLVCASTKSDEPVNLAFDLCRRKGRVSIVGDVGLGLLRRKMYRKELELRLSCSYGPGRYDETYEIQGHDYPVGQVRWTEGRNLEFFLRLLASKRLDLSALITSIVPIAEAPDAYSRIKGASTRELGVLLDYGPVPEKPPATPRIVRNPDIVHREKGAGITVGVIGVGGYVKGIHLPNLQRLDGEFTVRALASKSGASAATAARRFGVPLASSDYQQLLNDERIDAVIIATRHASHAKIVLDALEAGKHVFVEKPMTTRVADGQAIVDKATEKGLVLRVGFNRRFSPYLAAMRSAIGRSGVRLVSCRANIGALGDDWSNTPREGGRLLGEGVHFFDLCNWLLDAEPDGLCAVMAGEPKVTNSNVMVVARYPDGSIAQVTYTTCGHRGMGKEYFEAFGNGRSVRSDDFNSVSAFGTRTRVPRKQRGNKGQLEALSEFGRAVRGKPSPIMGADGRAGLVATWMAQAALESAAKGEFVERDT